ncbi:uncharacterized protein BJ212DRAFT_1303384 [Suillus subaureus]|uniref:Uncharacterized protein n=1 Tax=Suillus subaureus TaxID=48587 RepID=A0A9P7E084_9AGAM|nr:uncharacterized protein BJ212DRAFT_1303384 [Suillus subaureus]KAG1807674.1 hypothetical protein BJ212DRAFT_1303384 [Suillus subaureus]
MTAFQSCGNTEGHNQSGFDFMKRNRKLYRLPLVAYNAQVGKAVPDPTSDHGMPLAALVSRWTFHILFELREWSGHGLQGKAQEPRPNRYSGRLRLYLSRTDYSIAQDY